ncbi:hypothetical protein [Paenibacillus lutrae]|uniref:Uncharacterized protein n=1 Tax=Paenibacillus lutrae TaxID=2078573 RepID=A0A7X3JYZ5_9BACL|nr:hypothetical protein [Paenibacillus lutrae]MVO99469.1 hypothetical protein [Paenibacillus lutrae]
MSEESILAAFKSPEEAEAAAAKLRVLRAIDLQIDRIDRYQGNDVQQVMNPLSGGFASLGNLTQAAEWFSPDAGILGAADTTASGMSDGGQGMPTGRDILLTVVVEESTRPLAVRVIEQCGGEI